MPTSILTIKDLTKQFNDADFIAVNDISFAINQGEIVGILGPNGAGKTTLISMICGYVKPTSGQIELAGLNFSKNAKSIQQMIGVVPQEYALYETLTARENLIYFGAMYGLKGKDLHQKITIALNRLGLSKFADKKIETFSGGMKRRVNLIAGILHQPKILFLDEPTVGVDVQSKHVIVEYLRELNKNGMSIIYTSHHLTEAQDLCTSIFILDHGKVIATGTPEELIESVNHAQHLEDVFIGLTGNSLRDHV